MMDLEMFIPIFGVIGFFGSIIIFIYMHYKSRHVERMALIESGQSAELFNKKKFTDTEAALRTGLFLIGGGSGFMIGKIVESALNWGDGSGIIPITLIGAGIGLVIFYNLITNKKKDSI